MSYKNFNIPPSPRFLFPKLGKKRVVIRLIFFEILVSKSRVLRLSL